MIRILIFLAATFIGFSVYSVIGALVGSILSLVLITLLTAKVSAWKREFGDSTDFLIKKNKTL